MLCFSTPFCQSYEYLVYEESCNLYSNSKVETYYKNLMDKFKKLSTGSNFNLIHLLQANLVSLVQVDPNSNSTKLVDKKYYPECEPKLTAEYDDVRCSDELAEFTDTYVLEDLIPSARYQFRVGVANAFGVSDSFLSPEIESKTYYMS